MDGNANWNKMCKPIALQKHVCVNESLFYGSADELADKINAIYMLKIMISNNRLITLN